MSGRALGHKSREARQREIIQMTQRMIEADGADGVTVAKVALRLRISRYLIHKYIGGRKKLIEIART